MASVAHLATELLSRKGAAQPMPNHGRVSQSDNLRHFTWRPKTSEHMQLTPMPRQVRRRVVAAGPKQNRVRVSLRLTPEMHGKLKTLSKVTERTQQSLFVQALNELIVENEEHLELAGDRRFPAVG